MAQPTRFLVEHCLYSDGKGSAVLSLIAESFEAVANAVLTNNGEFSPVHIAGLSLEAYQPDFDDWIAARTMEDLMVSRKLRVVGATATAEHHDVQPLPVVVEHVSPPPQVEQQAPPKSVTIGLEDVLAAIASLPRAMEPSCSRVLEHLARQSSPDLGMMIEAGMRRCNHPSVWDDAPPVPMPQQALPLAQNSAPPPSAEMPPAASSAQPLSEADKKMIISVFGRHTSLAKSEFTKRCDQRLNFEKPEDRTAFLEAAIRDGIIRRFSVPEGGGRRRAHFALVDGVDGSKPADSVEKRPRDDQQPHPTDGEHELDQRRRRSEDPKSSERRKDICGKLDRWGRDRRGELCGFINVDPEYDISSDVWVHIKHNPKLEDAKRRDRVRFDVIPGDRQGQMKAVDAAWFNN